MALMLIATENKFFFYSSIVRAIISTVRSYYYKYLIESVL